MMRKMLFFGISLCAVLNASGTEDEPLSKQPWSHFGELRKAYAAGRKGYPEEVYAILKKYAKTTDSIVDLGSGTGISTRQLCQHGFKKIIGVDRDLLMIQEARGTSSKDCPIQYVEGDVSQRLPFPDENFDVATSFSSFHWFSNPSSIKEVARILKPGGYYFIVRGGNRSENEKKENNPIDKEIRDMIANVVGKPLPRKHIDVATAVEAQGFQIVVNAPVTYTNEYTVDEFLNNVHSQSNWNFVKDSPQVESLNQKIKDYLEKQKDDKGLIKETKTIRVVLAQKKK